jgi:hypothetical protein
MSGVPVDELRERVQRLMPQAREELARMVSLQSVYDPGTASICSATVWPR